MSSKEDTDNKVLNHPTTLKLFLFAKALYPKDFGVREAKRQLDFNSPSTVLWHLEKLEEAELLEKLPSNRYKLQKKGLDIKDLHVPVTLSAQIINGELIPRRIFLIVFLLTTFIVTLVLIFVNPLVAAINGTILVGVNCVLYIINYRVIRKQLSYYTWEKQKQRENENFLTKVKKWVKSIRLKP